MRVEHAGLASIFDPGGEIVVKMNRFEASCLISTFPNSALAEDLKKLLAELEGDKR